MSNKDRKAEARERFKKIRESMAGEFSEAMRRPKSKYGGPVRISSGVPLKFPYTFTAKIMQFPWRYYFANNWIYRYYVFAVIACIPIFKKFSNMSNTRENREKWAKTRAKDHHEH